MPITAWAHQRCTAVPKTASTSRRVSSAGSRWSVGKTPNTTPCMMSVTLSPHSRQAKDRLLEPCTLLQWYQEPA